MRSFTAILATLSLPLFAFAAHHGHSARHDGDVALRARGDLLPKRNFQGRLTWYDISLYKYAPQLRPHFLCLISSPKSDMWWPIQFE